MEKQEMIISGGEESMKGQPIQHEQKIGGIRYIVKNHFKDNGKQMEKIVEDMIMKSNI